MNNSQDCEMIFEAYAKRVLQEADYGPLVKYGTDKLTGGLSRLYNKFKGGNKPAALPANSSTSRGGQLATTPQSREITMPGNNERAIVPTKPTSPTTPGGNDGMDVIPPDFRKPLSPRPKSPVVDVDDADVTYPAPRPAPRPAPGPAPGPAPAPRPAPGPAPAPRPAPGPRPAPPSKKRVGGLLPYAIGGAAAGFGLGAALDGMGGGNDRLDTAAYARSQGRQPSAMGPSQTPAIKPGNKPFERNFDSMKPEVSTINQPLGLQSSQYNPISPQINTPNAIKQAQLSPSRKAPIKTKPAATPAPAATNDNPPGTMLSRGLSRLGKGLGNLKFKSPDREMFPYGGAGGTGAAMSRPTTKPSYKPLFSKGGVFNR